ncbi:hypothetical protein JCM10213_001654 [Rhodosporidiobolus nylandii]
MSIHATSTTTLATLPPELLLKILFHACTTNRLSAPLLVHNQLTRLETACRACVYRNLAGVCREWRDAVREIMGREVVLANGCGSDKRDEEVLALVKTDERRAACVKLVDASLRRAVCSLGGWSAPPPVSAAGQSHSGDEGADITSQGVELERWREQCLNRERQRLYRLLSHCRLIDTLDVDLGFYHELRVQPALLPSTIRTLTLRNSEPLDTLALVNHLPLLEDLTLRLALAWLLPSSPSEPTPLGTCRLKRFELSTTAFGCTSLPSVLALLDNSLETVTSLTLRMKGTTDAAREAFFPVARGLVERFADQLEELVVKDVPRGGMRIPGDEASSDWLPPRPTAFPRLQHLHLTGLELPSPAFFSRTLVLPPEQHLRTLVVEDFDAPSLQPLIDALRTTPALGRLEELTLACAREVEMGRREGGVNEREQEVVEAWCEGKGREADRQTRLLAGWKMVKVSGCGFW